MLVCAFCHICDICDYVLIIIGIDHGVNSVDFQWDDWTERPGILHYVTSTFSLPIPHLVTLSHHQCTVTRNLHMQALHLELPIRSVKIRQVYSELKELKEKDEKGETKIIITPTIASYALTGAESQQEVDGILEDMKSQHITLTALFYEHIVTAYLRCNITKSAVRMMNEAHSNHFILPSKLYDLLFSACISGMSQNSLFIVVSYFSIFGHVHLLQTWRRVMHIW